MESICYIELRIAFQIKGSSISTGISLKLVKGRSNLSLSSSLTPKKTKRKEEKHKNSTKMLISLVQLYFHESIISIQTRFQETMITLKIQFI